MAYQITYSRTSRNEIKTLHPVIKPVIKSRIRELRDNPYLGKALERELSGYFSYRTKRFRIIYKIDEPNQNLEIHHIGHRRDIYEILSKALIEEDH